jgi:class 3 adenylate cyclase
VTVLFADLEGSMQGLADRDPEEAGALLDPVLERMMASVHRYEGAVNQVMGDGIMALSGAPTHVDTVVPYSRSISTFVKPMMVNVMTKLITAGSSSRISCLMVSPTGLIRHPFILPELSSARHHRQRRWRDS